jgi:hypothetical protein
MVQAQTAYHSMDVSDPQSKGNITNEDDGLGRYEATIQLDAPATVFLKATYHPDWHAYVDGKEVKPFMVTPSFPAITVPAGQHDVRFVYKSPPMRTGLFFLGVATLGLVAVGDLKRDWLLKLLQRETKTEPEAEASPD